MKIQFISLGSFCHPKMLIRDQKLDVQESLPFDFHSSPNTYSIYHILTQLYEKQKVNHSFSEISFEHSFNQKNTTELAVKDCFDMYFLHFFNKEDLNKTPIKYPSSVEYLKDSKIEEVKKKFDARYERLYSLLQNHENVLVFLRIENYNNPAWKEDLVQLTNALYKFKNPHIFLVYSQVNIDPELDFYYTNQLNYDYKIPVLFRKYNFDEKITSAIDEKNKFLDIFQIFKYIIDQSFIIQHGQLYTPFYHDKEKNLLIKLNNIHFIYKIIESKNQYLLLEHNEKKCLYFKNDDGTFSYMN